MESSFGAVAEAAQAWAGSLLGLHLCLLPRSQTLPCASSHGVGRVGHGVSIQLECEEGLKTN